MPPRSTLLLLASSATATILNSTTPYFIVSPPANEASPELTSRSPDEYIEWGWDRYCWEHSDDYSLERCVPSHELPSSGLPPSSGLWWLMPVAGESDEWFHIVGGVDSTHPAQMLRFDWMGDVHPRPYWTGDPEKYSDTMEAARFRIVVSREIRFRRVHIACDERIMSCACTHLNLDGCRMGGGVISVYNV